jgi:maltooligosyltrehalose trehalohydrolase
MKFHHTLPFGATVIPGGAVFRLWAPADVTVDLMFDNGQGEQRIPADRDNEGFRAAVVPLARPGHRYQWAVHTKNGEVRVPDPASRSNPDGVHAMSALVDANAFVWEPWGGRPWHEVVAYELHVGTFTPEGTFAAATRQLATLADTGITCIQLMPLASFPGRFGWGYDGVLPYAPQATYGTPEELKTFVLEAHRLNLMVMLDVVYNHFGPDGNYLSLYAPDFFTERHPTAWGAGINFDGERCGPVREFFIHNALYWLHEFQFDGLRFDAVHAMVDDSPEHILEELSRRARPHCAGRHIHLVLENDCNEPARLSAAPRPGRFDGQWSGDFHHTLHVHLTREHDGYYSEYAPEPLPMLARVLTRGFARTGSPHLSAEHSHARDPRRDFDGHVPLPTAVNFLHNHDQIGNRAFGKRLSQLIAPAPMRLCTALLLLSPHTPLLFMGEEWGAATPFLYFADWTGELRIAVVEGRRREFAQFPQFADPEVRDRIPDPCDESTMQRCRLDWAASEEPAQRAVRDQHRELLTLRKNELAPRLASLQTGTHDAQLSGNVLSVQWRFGLDAAEGTETLELVANLGDHPVDRVEVDRPTARTLHTVGEVGPHRLGAWSARWRWMSEP